MGSPLPPTGEHTAPTSIFELALQHPPQGSADAHALAALFDIRSGQAPCLVSPVLGAKFGKWRLPAPTCRMQD